MVSINQDQTNIQAPGKLILSGEHAVVHGRPALAFAVNRHARLRSEASGDSAIRFRLPEFNTELVYEPSKLPFFKEQRLNAYAEFAAGTRPISGVLDSALDIIPLAFALGAGPGLARLPGRLLTLQIEFPVGSGMGSSAAVSLVAAAAGALAANQRYCQEELFEWSLICERCMHGHPSGVDNYVCLHGGMVRYLNGSTTPRPAPAWKLTLLDTGRPQCSTGECVVHVGTEFPATDPIWDAFEALTNAIDQTLEGPLEKVLPLIRENHRLLCRIGVVPAPVQGLIQAIEAAGGAAKVCGAGAVTGAGGGVVLAFGDLDLQSIGASYRVTPVPCALTRAGVKPCEV